MNICDFCNNLTDLFGDHKSDCDHVDDSEYMEVRRRVLLHYLLFFIEKNNNEERKVTLGKCVEEKDCNKLKDVIKNNQYFYEPLYTILTERKIPVWWNYKMKCNHYFLSKKTGNIKY